MLCFVVAEVALLLALRYFRGVGIPAAALLLNIGAGTSLMMALRAELKAQGWMFIAVWLVVALFFHLADLAYRYWAARQPAKPVELTR